MCGIFGVIQAVPINKQLLLKVSKSISHRGPDDEGYLLIKTANKTVTPCIGPHTARNIELPDIKLIDSEYDAAFLHRRLSIIDTGPTGHQPMSYQNSTLWITYNGEIYNYLELREELKDKGFKFFTSSDTEVILASYLYWGTECTEKFNGIWAFALYDREKNIFFLSRDRVGVKPLYYYSTNDVFLFASEVKAIRTYLKNQLGLNFNKLEQYLTIGQIFIGIDDDTFFTGVKQLTPGCNLTLSNGNINISKYWSPIIYANSFNLEENVNKFKELFYNTIKMQFRSDVEVGSCLSGGLDSSSIVSVAATLFERKLNTFSAIWPNTRIDESFFINEVNSKFNCNSHAFEPNVTDILGLIDEVLWHQEIPLSGASLIAQWKVFEMVKKYNVKVVLDGEGSDEILAGYPKYIITYLNEMMLRSNWFEILRHYGSLKESGYSMKSILNSLRRNKRLKKRHLQFNQYPYKYSNLASYLVDEISYYSLPTLLHDKDRSSMAHSVEARVPFLDHKLIEFALSIPAEQKIQGGLTKMILRESLRDILPVSVYKRKDKIGFATPIEERFFPTSLNISDSFNKSNPKSLLSEIFDMQKYDLDRVFGYRKNFCIYNIERFVQIWG